jgi:hypothetical protein
MVGLFFAPERNMYMLSKSLAKQEARHSERSEESPTFTLFLFSFTFFISVFSVSLCGKKNCKSCLSCLKSKFDKTNPISKSLTYYNERNKLKIAKSKRTQTKPMQHGRSFQLRSHSAWPQAILIPVYLYPCILVYLFHKNKPNFFTTKYALSISKTQKWRPKTDPKKRNKPICG